MHIIRQWTTYSPAGRDWDGEEDEATYQFNLKAIVARPEFENIKQIVGRTFATISHGRNPHNGCGDYDSDLFHVTYSTDNVELFHKIGGNVESCENSYEYHFLPFVADEKYLAERGLRRDKVGDLPYKVK